MINGQCFTNIDDFKNEIWPDKFYKIPIEGAWVQSKSGRVAQVCKIIHTTRKELNISKERKELNISKEIYETHPFIRIEITKIA